MALPNTNISVSMVRDELGAGTNDVGQLCIHPNINKWSKWKPVRHDKVVGLVESDLESVNCGLNIPYVSSLAQVISTYRGGILSWEYDKPRGGSLNEPYRLGDFRNYEHSVGKQYSILFPDTIIESSRPNVDTSVTFSRLFNPFGVTFDDLSRINTDLYYGALIVKQGSTTPVFNRIANRSIGDPLITNPISLALELPGTPAIGDFYDIMTFIAVPNISGKIPIPAQNNCTYWLLDNGHMTVQYLDLDIYTTLSIIRIIDGISVKLAWAVSVINNSSIPVTINDLILSFTSSNYPEWQQNPVYLDSFIAPANDTYALNGEFPIAYDHGTDRVDIFSNSAVYPKLYANSYVNIP